MESVPKLQTELYQNTMHLGPTPYAFVLCYSNIQKYDVTWCFWRSVPHKDYKRLGFVLLSLQVRPIINADRDCCICQREGRVSMKLLYFVRSCMRNRQYQCNIWVSLGTLCTVTASNQSGQRIASKRTREREWTLLRQTSPVVWHPSSRYYQIIDRGPDPSSKSNRSNTP